MRWGSRKQPPGTPPCAPERVTETPGRKGTGKSKAFAFSFSPLSWLAKLAPKPKGGTKRAPASSNEDGGATPAFPSCEIDRTSPAKAVIATAGRPGSPRRSPTELVGRRLSVGTDAVAARGRHRSPAAAVEEVVQRRLSVSNDSADVVAARQQCRLRRHRSVGGDRDLQAPLGHLIPFSLAGSPAPPPPPKEAAAPSDTDAGSARLRRRHRGRRNRRTLSGGRRSSFSGRTTLRVKLRSSRRAGADLETLAVVRRTRDPQRAFRESMSVMITSSGGRPEELERLLACYLALNADEHHGCIIKVFRQVCFDHVNGQPAAVDPAGALRPPRAGPAVN